MNHRPEHSFPADAPDSSGLGQWKPRRKTSVLVVLLGILALVVLGVWWLAIRPRPKGNRLLVLIRTESRDGSVGEWWGTGGRASGRCSDRLDQALSGLGMDVVKAGDAKTLDALEGRSSPAELRQAALSLEAGVLLSGTLRVVEVRELGGSDGQKDVGLELELELASTEESGSLPLGERPVRLHLAVPETDGALLTACEQLPATVVPMLARRIRELGPLKSLLEREAKGRALDDTVVVERLRPLLDVAHRHDLADQARREAEQQLRERDAKQEHGELRKQLLGAFLGEEYWVGPGSGTDVVVMALPYRLVLPDEVAQQYELRPEHEQLLAVGVDGRDRRTLLEVFNIYSFPTVSADGGSAALVLDHRQWSKALAVASLGDGSVHELIVHRSHYFSSPVISPDGRHVVFWSSTSRDGDKSLEVIDSTGSDRRVLVPAPWARMDQPEWLPDSRSVVLSLKGLDELTSSVWQIDVASGEQILLAGVEPTAAGARPREDQGRGKRRPAMAKAGAAGPADQPDDARKELPSSYLRPTVAPNGSFLVVVEESTEGMWLGRLELGDRRYQRLAQAPAGRVSIAPDSSRVAFETAPTSDPEDESQDDLELALIAASGGVPRLLTRNGIDDSLAGWSRDGRRLYFQQGGGDPDGKHRNNRIYWIEP